MIRKLRRKENEMTITIAVLGVAGLAGLVAVLRQRSNRRDSNGPIRLKIR